MLGIICAATWGSERIIALKPTQTVSISGYDLSFDGISQRPGPNYDSLIAKFTVRRDGAVVGVMEPSKRTFSSRSMTTNEAALMTIAAGQLYMSLGDPNDDGALAIRLYYKPMVMLIWLGAVVMMLGGALSLSDRRLRVGAPKPAAKSAMQAAE
jgi:cytochrome c-type biogenesis protein CcmF